MIVTTKDSFILLPPSALSRFRKGLRAPFTAAFLLALSGCSYVPDALNPIEWYNGIFGDDEAPAQAQAQPQAQTAQAQPQAQPQPQNGAPPAKGKYPDLSTVPAAPSATQRQEIKDNLAAEPQPQYTDQPLASAAPAAPASPAFLQNEQAGALAAAPPPPPSSGQPAASPVPPVESMGAPAQPVAPPPPSLGEKPEEEKAVADSDAAAQAPNSLESFDSSKALISMQIGEIRFGHGSAALSGADEQKLREIVDMLKKQDGTLRVVGHASSRTGNMDPLTHQIANFGISVRRANAVANALMRMGVPGEKLYVGAVADSEPIYYEVMPAGEQGNRRTEIFLDY